ncbi:MAG TPA: YraN family protein [bacterium]|nr:YraN family protein [bacterium]
MRTSPARGGWAEEQAARYLTEELGYRLLDRNVRLAGGEIDLVLNDRGTQVFVEVKARRGAGRAAGAVTADKRRRVSRAAALWVARHGVASGGCRFDVVTVEGRGPSVRLEHIPSAFEAADRYGV